MLIRNPVFVVWEIFFRVKFSEVRYIWTAWVSCEFITSFTHACMLTAVKSVRMLKTRARAWEWIAPFP